MRYKGIYFGLGIPATILGAIISAAVFGTFKNCDCTTTCYTDEWVRIFSGIVALLSAVLTAVISFIDAGGMREKHKGAADSYDQLAHQIDSILRTPTILRGDPTTVVQEIRTSFDNVVKDSPYIPSEYEATLTYIRGDGKKRVANPGSKKEPSSNDEILVEIPPAEMSMFDVGKLKFDESLLKSLRFELSRLNSDDKKSESDSE